MSTGSAAWVDVIPNMATFSKLFTAGTVASAKKAGVSAGRSFSDGVTAGSAGAKSATATLVEQMELASKRAASAVKAETTAVTAARNAERVAAQNVVAAEVRLSEQRTKSGASSSQALKAEAQLTAAKGREQLATTKLTNQVEVLKAAQNESKVATTQLTDAQALLAKEQAASTTGFAKFTSGAAKVEQTASGMTTKLKSAAGMAGMLGAGFAAFEVAGFVKESFQAATEFQKDTNVLVTAAGESQSALAGVRKGLLDVSSNTGASLSQLSEGMYTVEKAGIRGAAGVEVMGVAAKGAADEGADLGVVSNALTSVMHNYASSMKSPQKAMNAIMVAAGHSKTSLQDFSNSLSSVLPVASKVGIPFNQIAGALGTMTASGMSAQQASQDLNHTIASLASPTRVMSEEMNAFGLDSAKVRDDLSKKGLQGTIEELSDAVKAKLGPSVASASKVIASMPATVQQSYAELANGTKTLVQFTNSVQNSTKLTATQKDQIMSAVPAARGYTQAMKNMTGGIVGLNTTYMLTGSSAKGFSDRTTEVGKAMNSTADFQKKWNLTSQTTATRLAIAKATISNVGTSLAGDLLPGLASMAKWFATAVKDAVSFTSANKQWLLPLLAGLGSALLLWKSMTLITRGYAAAVGIVRGGIMLYIAATKGMAVAQRVMAASAAESTGAFWGLDAAMDANPAGAIVAAVTIVVAALAALVAGVIYAYNHWTWFRVGVQAVWKGIQVAASFAWKSILQPVFTAIGVAVVATGKWFVWLWQSVIVPAWNGIVTAFKVAGAIAVGIWDAIVIGAKAVGNAFVWFGALVVTIAKAVAAPFVWLWQTILEPIFAGIGSVLAWFGQAFYAVGVLIGTIARDLIGAAITWVYNTVIKPFAAWVGAALTVVGGWFTWLYANAIKPAWDGIVAAITVAWTWISGVFTTIASWVTGVLGAAFSWLYNSVIKPVWNAISTVITWAYNSVILPIFGWIRQELAIMGAGFTLLYTKYISPAWNAISGAISKVWNKGILPVFNDVKHWVTVDIPGAFSTAVTAIGKAWKTVQDVVKEPIRFIVNTVLDGGLIDPFNSIAKKIEGKGATLIPRISLPKGFAGGGVLPGYQSAKRDELMVPMRKGEGVLVPEVVRALGPGFVHALNAAGNSGGVNAVRSMAGYASGGIVGDITSFLSNPLGSLSKIVTNAEAAIPGAGVVVDLAKGITSKLVSSAASAIGKMFGSSSASASAGGTSANPTGSGVTRWTADVKKALAANGLSTSSAMVAKVLRQIQTESGGNPAAVQHGYTDVNTISGDLAKGLMQTISATFNAYKFPGHGDIFNGYDNLLAALNYAKHRYGSNLDGLGEGHGYAYGGIVPTLYDQGGVLPPGLSVVSNKTGRPEYVLPPRDTSALGSGRSVVNNWEIHEVHDTEGFAQAVTRRQNLGLV